MTRVRCNNNSENSKQSCPKFRRAEAVNAASMEAVMSVYEQGGKVAEQGVNMARSAARKGEQKVEQTIVAAQEGFQMAGYNARQLNLKLLDMMRANAEAFFNFAEDLMTTKDPSKLMEI